MKALLGKLPLSCIGVGVVLAVFTGGFWWVLVGACAAGASVTPQLLSTRRRTIAKVAGKDAKRLEDLEKLDSDIQGVQGIPGAEQYGMQLREQFDGVNTKYLSFRDLLATKFNPSELTFGRYLKSAEQVYLSTLDEIQRAAVMLSGLRAVDLDQIRARVRMLKRIESPSEAEAEELAAFEQRLEVRERELESVRGLLSSNEKALTTMTLAGTTLAQLQTEDGRTALDSDTAMRELEELASRSERYSLAQTKAQS